MIPNQWYVILESREVRRGRPVGVLRMGERLVLWRNARGELGCMSDFCPHRGAALSAGKLVADDVACPFHGFRFDQQGRCTLIPANGRQADVPKAFKVRRVYPVREAHGFIYLWWGEPARELPSPPFFDAIDETRYAQATLRDLWHTHYGRAIENQLDVAHLPFVHATTIGRGNRTVVNGPRVQVTCDERGDRIEFWVDNAVDASQRPLKPDEMPVTDRHPGIQFIFPNLWHNWIADDLRIIAAFAPIDAEHTLMYIRTYQRIVRVPVARELFNLLNLAGNFMIERQDKPVVETQRPFRAELRGGEKLIPADSPIIAYRRRRDELIAAAAAADETAAR